MKIQTSQIFQLLFLFITVASIGVHTSLNLSNTYFWWSVDALSIFLIFRLKPYYFDKLNNNTNIWPIKLFVLWNILTIIRGLFVAENYWDFKQLIGTSLVLLIPLTIYISTNKVFVQKLISFWLKYALLILFIFVPFITFSDFYGRYLVPIIFLLLIFPLLPYRWKMIVLFFTALVFLAGFDARSNIIRFSVAIFFGSLFYFRGLIQLWMLKLGHIILLLLPIILLLLAMTDVFNVFKMSEYIKGDYSVITTVDGNVRENKLTSDTRTFIYVEAINSAINNNYILLGRTPARGYDSSFFGEHAQYELGTGRMERYSSEVSIINIFTWTGLIGVVLYFLVFFWASFLAIYRSNSFFIKIMGLFVAFRWAFAFVEDFTLFDIQYVFLWFLIGMCYSYEFRKMDDKEFKYWVRGIFRNMKFKRHMI